jgi:hypothetical protein
VGYGLVRRMWHQLEPIHAVLWYAPEAFGAGLLPGQSTLGIANVPVPSPRSWPA